MSKKAYLSGFSAILISLVTAVLLQFFSDSVNYYLTSVLMLIISMLPFFASFEIKKITSREVTLVSTLIAIAVVSRAVFYLIPQVKPIAAVVIVSAICLGAERGYIIGAFSAFISNFIFGQGYWTPFQMVALGTVGLCAGLIFKVLKPKKLIMAIVGFILTFVIYGLIVDLSTMLMAYGNNLNIKSVLSVYLAGMPFNMVFAASTAIFLFIFGEPFIKKINRINTKYSLTQ